MDWTFPPAMLDALFSPAAVYWLGFLIPFVSGGVITWAFMSLSVDAQKAKSQQTTADFGLASALLTYYFFLTWCDETGGVFHPDDERNYVLLQRYWESFDATQQDKIIAQFRTIAEHAMSQPSFKLRTHQITAEDLVKHGK